MNFTFLTVIPIAVREERNAIIRPYYELSLTTAYAERNMSDCAFPEGDFFLMNISTCEKGIVHHHRPYRHTDADLV
jgi:hypothetical protein